jgi:O-methyltransferase
MSDGFERELVGAALDHVAAGRERIALLGLTPAALRVRRQLAELAPGADVLGVFDPDADPGSEGSAWSDLADKDPDLLVVCADAEKQDLLEAYRDLERSNPRATDVVPAVVIAGTAHLAFRDAEFEEVSAPTLAPSYANGSPNTLVHLFQCLQAAAANELRGAVVEFGCFKGGTSVLLSRMVKRLGLRDCPLFAFDSFAGFPPPRAALDLYRHPRCEFTAEDEVRAYLEPHGVEVVSGDIAESYTRLEGLPLLLCFFDTDNYTPARAALELCVDQLVPGGAIVFDHYATVPEFVYTLGERIAADEVLADRGLLHLHDTGVFLKLGA